MTAHVAVPAGVIDAAGGHAHPEPEWVARAADEFGMGWARTAWQRAASQPGALFDQAKADAAVKLWPQFFRLTDDRFAGKSFRLGFWQEVILRLLVGWKIPVDNINADTGLLEVIYVRLFRRLLLWVPRKNGKSEFLAALALFFFIFDSVTGGQGFCFARDENQAKVVFNKMKVMLSYHPKLNELARPFQKSIYVARSRSSFALLAGKPEGKHGLSPTVIVGDEMHEWKTEDVATFLRQGTGTRLQPIELYASTAGVKSNETGWKLWEETCAIIDGRLDIPTTLAVVFAADQEADFNDEREWRAANPSLGISPTFQYLKGEAAKAAENPRAEAHFRCYHLNQWIDSVSRWLSIKKWDACTDNNGAWADWTDGTGLEGRRCFGGIDISSKNDITARAWVFPPDSEFDRWLVSLKFWVPEEAIRIRSKRDRVSYDRWEKIGAIVSTPGDFIDQNFVMQDILQGLQKFDVAGIGRDPFDTTKLHTDLVKEGVDPDLMQIVRQGHLTLSEPTKFLEELVTTGMLDHGGHPVLRWMAGNTAIRFDENLNYVPAKKKSAEKIDGIAAILNGLRLAIASTGDPLGPELYV